MVLAFSPLPEQDTGPSASNTRAVQWVLWVTLALNLAVTVAKLTLGFMTGTLSLIADGFHSLLDGSSNIVALIALRVSASPPDRDHPYGHRKFEAFGAMIISFFLFLASFNVLQETAQRFLNPQAHTPSISWLNYAVVVFSLLVSLWVTRYESRRGRELNSPLLLADAQHTLADVYNLASVLIALVAIQLGWVWVDAVAAAFIVVMIFRAGYGIIKAHLGALVDEATLDPARIEAVVLQTPGVRGCHKIRSRGMDHHMFVDLHIQVDPALTVAQAHRIADAVEQALCAMPQAGIHDVLVHVEEADDTGTPLP